MITRFEIKENDIFVNIQLDVQENYAEWLSGETAQNVMQDFTERNITESEYIKLADTALTSWEETALVKVPELNVEIPIQEISQLTIEQEIN